MSSLRYHNLNIKETFYFGRKRQETQSVVNNCTVDCFITNYKTYFIYIKDKHCPNCNSISNHYDPLML